MVRLGRCPRTAGQPAEPEQGQRQGPLGVLGHGDRPGRMPGVQSRPAEDRPDPRGGVLQVRTGVAGQRQHPVEVEGVPGVAGNREIRVLERADADRIGDLVTQVRVVVPVSDHLFGPLDRLVDESDQLDRFAGAGTNPPAIRPGDQADHRVLRPDLVRQPPGLAGDREQHPEVKRLLGADHVDEPGGFQVLDAVPDRGQVGGVVAVASVALPQDHRLRRPVPAGEAGRKGNERAVADHRDPGASSSAQTSASMGL